MEFLVRVEDSKAPFFLELMKNLRPVKVERISEMETHSSSEKKQLLRELKQAVDEVKAADRGEIQLRSARDFLREL